MLSDGQLVEFANNGYLVVSGVVSEALLAAADAEIDALLTREPAPSDTVGKHFWFLPPSQLPAAHAALVHSGTLLAGIFLTDETEIDQGSVWVWPGSHLVHQQLFHDRGADVLMQTGGHITMLSDSPRLPRPAPVLGRRGDLLLAHFLLGHNTGGNLSPTTRRMLYYRLGCPAHASRWEATFLDAFAEYAPVRRVLARGMTPT